MNAETIRKALNWRYATKKFDPRKTVSDAELQVLLEAARMAPTSFGLQPFRVLHITNPKIRERLQEAAWGQSEVTEASHFLVFAITTPLGEAYVRRFVDHIIRTRGVNPESVTGYAEMMRGFVCKLSPAEAVAWSARQAYIALGFLLEAAALMGIDCCPMEGFIIESFDEILGLKEKGLSAAVLCAIGHRADDDAYAQAAKVRFPMEEMVIRV